MLSRWSGQLRNASACMASRTEMICSRNRDLVIKGKGAKKGKSQTPGKPLPFGAHGAQLAGSRHPRDAGVAPVCEQDCCPRDLDRGARGRSLGELLLGAVPLGRQGDDPGQSWDGEPVEVVLSREHGAQNHQRCGSHAPRHVFHLLRQSRSAGRRCARLSPG